MDNFIIYFLYQKQKVTMTNQRKQIQIIYNKNSYEINVNPYTSIHNVITNIYNNNIKQNFLYMKIFIIII